MYYQCLTPNPFYEFLTYTSDEIIPLGSQVLLPYGKKMVYGWVWNVCAHPLVDPCKIKKIEEVTSGPLLPDEWRAWIEWVSSYYHVPTVQFLMQTLPPFLWQPLPELPESYVTYYQDPSYPDQRVPGGLLVQDKKWSFSQLKKKIPTEMIRPSYKSAPFELSETQKVAIGKITPNVFQVSLLEGATGSGKTEVYLERLCEIAQHRPVLLMMPEITLTQSMLARLTERLGAPPWVYHSQLPKKVRIHHWLAAARNLPGLWIGTRSSAFLPVQWGMVVMDEEHDGSYAQSQKMYYSAKHAMLMRAKRLTCPMVLGSATPSLESLYLSKTGVYQSLLLEKNFSAPIRVHVMDARKESIYDGLLPSVSAAIDRQLKKGHQVLLFLNRRGYSPVLFCKTCSWKSECAHCDANMVVHLKKGQLRCHHCGFQGPRPLHCPAGHDGLIEVGLGTQRLEELLVERYPKVKLLRIDQDSTQKEREALEELLATPEAAIVIGTQMIAKGLDAPHIRCVVIVQLDQQLLNTGYRSDERAYQLLTQVMGRAARRKREDDALPDELWIQTYFPDHALWQHLLKGELASYPELLLSWRKQQFLPPYGYVCQLRLEDRKESQLVLLSKNLKKYFKQLFSSNAHKVMLYGPFPSNMVRKKNHYHYLGMVVTANRSDMDKAMSALTHWLSETKVRWSLERDAQDTN